LQTGEALSLVVFLHGWNGCAAALVGSGPTPCVSGGRALEGWGLGEEHDAAGSKSLLVVPQLAYRRRSGDPGRFAESGFFDAFLEELLETGLTEETGAPRSTNNLQTITLVAHSAGYETALAILRGRAEDESPPIERVILLDSLYDSALEFASWLGRAPNHRLLSVYTGGASTRRQSRKLARLVGQSLGESSVAHHPEGSLSEALASHRLVVTRTRIPHGDIPRRMLAEILRPVDGSQAPN